MKAKIKHVCSQVLRQITPTHDERKKILALAKDLEQKVATSAKKRGIEAVVRVEGSVAKDTWLSEEPDVDVFMCLPTTIARKALGAISLAIAREATDGWRQVERFAEHPYLEAFVRGFRVNIVPCYCAVRGGWLSATDRTPFHTDYVNKRLNETLRGEVRLLKKFMQSIEVYGAEIKVGGFSGYLCELLIIHYGSFAKVLEAFGRYAPRMVIDIETYYAGREKELSLLFAEPLVVIDPVDKIRNVASAVKPEKIYNFVGASRAFLKSPNTDFFNPPTRKPLPAREMRQGLRNLGSDFLFLTFKPVEAVPDVVWGQLYKTQRAIQKILEINDFSVLRGVAWSDEMNLSLFALELEQRTISATKKHVGPPLEREKECEDFLAKYVRNGCVASGPYIEEGRWMVEVLRKDRDAVELLRGKLKEGGRNVGVAKLISLSLKGGFNILVNSEASEIYSGNEKFREFLTDFLSGKPFWLELNETQTN